MPKSNIPNKIKQSQSVFQRVLRPLILLVIVQVLLLLIAMKLSGLTSYLFESERSILRQQVKNRLDYLENEMTSNWSNLDALSDYIDQTALELLNEGKISIETLDNSSANCLSLLQNISPKVINTMYQNQVTGIFVILNTDNPQTMAQSGAISKPGIYLRDLDPTSESSARNSDLLWERAPIALVQSTNVSTDSNWRPLFNFSNEKEIYNFIRQPIEAAFQNPKGISEADCGFWGPPINLQNNERRAITYSRPLILPDGTIYGVLGIDLLEDYLNSMLPAQELSANRQGSYILAINHTKNEIYHPAIASGSMHSLLKGVDHLSIKTVHNDQQELILNNTRYYCSVAPMTLYNNNTPFEEDVWVLMGVMPIKQLYLFPHQIRAGTIFVAFITLVSGIFISMLVSRQISRPIQHLHQEIIKPWTSWKIPKLPRTGITEIDDFAQTITSLSQDIVTSSTKFLQIMEMASVEIAGFEIITDMSSFFATDNLFSLLGEPNLDHSKMTTQEFRSNLLRIYHNAIKETISDTEFLLHLHPEDQSERYIRLKITHGPLSYIGLVEDNTQETLERLRIEQERDYDLLTGLYNRRAFHRLAHSLFEKPEKLGCAAMMLLDLDSLKSVNDKFGHDWGDRYISMTGCCLSKNLPANTLCARLSGDEFLIFFHGYNCRSPIYQIIDQLQEKLRAQALSMPNGEMQHISVSGGLTWYPDDASSLDTLLPYADFAMYQAKAYGKNRIIEFDANEYAKSLHQMNCIREFRRILTENLLTYHFQPIFDSTTGAPAAYEALMRAENLSIPMHPGIILQIAKNEGYLPEIEQLTWTNSLACFSRLLNEQKAEPTAMLFINSLANQIIPKKLEESLCQQYNELLSRTVIEITESEDMDINMTISKRKFGGEHRLFALDDYGSGYNSEKNLLALSPDFIKVDMDLIRNIDTDMDKFQIVSNIVQYAHQKGMRVIAEGLETPEELQTVLNLHIDFLQGYYLARPSAVPPPISSEALKMIQAHNKKTKSGENN